MWSRAVCVNKEFRSNNLFMNTFLEQIFLVQKKFVQKMCENKKNGPKMCWVKKKYWVKTFLAQKMLCKKLWVEIFLMSKKFQVNKILPKNFWHKQLGKNCSEKTGIKFGKKI